MGPNMHFFFDEDEQIVFYNVPSNEYLIDLIAIKEQQRHNLRSASGLILKYPSLKLKKTLGDRAFSSAAPNLWNNLPLHIRLEDNFERFKSLLKTHLFRLAFDM